MKKIFLATKNKGKISQMKDIFSNWENIEVYSYLDLKEDIPDVDEDGATFLENSIKKAVEIAKHMNTYVIADDSGIVVEALNGEPGVYSARYAGEDASDKENNLKLVQKMKNQKNRKCKYVAVITIASPELEIESYRGEIEGELLNEERGNDGFGYDPLFYLELYGKTFAELNNDIKNKISHRALALEQLKRNINTFIK